MSETEPAGLETGDPSPARQSGQSESLLYLAGWQHKHQASSIKHTAISWLDNLPQKPFIFPSQNVLKAPQHPPKLDHLGSGADAKVQGH